MMVRKGTTVSIRANGEYVRILRALAGARGIPYGQLVREALDAQLGPEIERMRIFFRENGNLDEQLQSKQPEV